MKYFGFRMSQRGVHLRAIIAVCAYKRHQKLKRRNNRSKLPLLNFSFMILKSSTVVFELVGTQKDKRTSNILLKSEKKGMR
jgi:hypothetical protein